MNYSNKTLGDNYHTSHGPQPEGEAMDSSYLTEVDKFLKGEDNNPEVRYPKPNTPGYAVMKFACNYAK